MKSRVKITKIVSYFFLMVFISLAFASECAAYHLGDFVWYDLDRDGIQDDGEPGVEGVQVDAYTCAGIYITTVLTDVDGYYFVDLYALGYEGGDYYVIFSNLPTGYAFTLPNQGGDDTIDSDADQVTGATQCVTLLQYPAPYIHRFDHTLDAGIYIPGTGTPGYWKNHPEAWPVDDITIGCTPYTKDAAIVEMMKPVKGDKTNTMFNALTAAWLNLLAGNDFSCIVNGDGDIILDVILDADAWMCDQPDGVKVKGNSPAWKEGEPLYLILDDYNNGLFCAPSRDELE